MNSFRTVSDLYDTCHLCRISLQKIHCISVLYILERTFVYLKFCFQRYIRELKQNPLYHKTITKMYSKIILDKVNVLFKCGYLKQIKQKNIFFFLIRHSICTQF